MPNSALGCALAAAALSVAGAAQALPTCQVGLHAPLVSPRNNSAVIIAADPAKGSYQVRSDDDGMTDWVSAYALRYSCVGGQAAAIDLSYFVGRWSMFVGPTPNTVDRSGHLFLEVGPGGASPPIIINADGTYAWKVDSSTVVRGRWRAMAPNEMRSGSRGPGILIVSGEGGHNWQMTRRGVNAGSNRDQVDIDRMDLGTSYMATRQ
ncbi:MAG: hypothetical protein ABI655_08610 [Phenylobacterium sp.]